MSCWRGPQMADLVLLVARHHLLALHCLHLLLPQGPQLSRGRGPTCHVEGAPRVTREGEAHGVRERGEGEKESVSERSLRSMAVTSCSRKGPNFISKHC